MSKAEQPSGAQGALPPEVKDRIARTIATDAARDIVMAPLTPDEMADLAAAQAEMSRGEFATEAEVYAVLPRYQP